MQLPTMTALLPLLLGATCLHQGRAAVLRSAGQSDLRVKESVYSLAAARSAEWAAAVQVESDDGLFWTSEYAKLEAELLQLQAAANVTNASSAPAAKAAVPHVANATKSASKHSHSENPLAGLKLNLEPKSPADLVPALAMLKGLYADGKDRIAKLNAREQESKKRYSEKEKQHNARIAQIEARGKNHTLSDEFRANETRDENRLWTYWERVRERQHRQFHTSLKIQHGTMERVKGLIDMYEKAISGKADKAEMQQKLARVGAGIAPEVVLLQDTARAAAHFASEALEEVRQARTELKTELRGPARGRPLAG